MNSRTLAIIMLCAVGCSSGSSTQAGSNESVGGSADSGIGEAGETDTWSNWAHGFFTKYCVECHSPSDPTGPDFTQKSVVVSNAPTIRCGVSNTQAAAWMCPSSPHAQQFPIADAKNTNPKPTSVERDRMVAWISAGCP